MGNARSHADSNEETKGTTQLTAHAPLCAKQSTSRSSLASLGSEILHTGLHAANKQTIQSFSEKTSITCADCVDGGPPRWCAIGFGAFVCDDCAGALRSLPASTHGGVRSLYLDVWTDEMVKDVVAAGGNEVTNELFEYCIPNGVHKPHHGFTSGAARREWVWRKYEAKEFIRKAGLPSRKASIAKKPHTFRATSFAGGKELLVGIMDLVVTDVKELPNPKFHSRRLAGGFILSVVLGRFHAKTRKSLSGRKWLGERMQLSWDGHSPLNVSVITGFGKVIATQTRRLHELDQPGSQTLTFELKLDQDHKNTIAELDSCETKDPVLVTLMMEFVDLRS